MKTIFVFGIRGFPWVGGGAERHCEEVYPRLSKEYNITILTRRKYFDEWKGVKFIKIPYIDNRYLETISHSILCALYCLFKRPNIVHIHNMGACLLTPLLSFLGIKVILTIHSLNYEHKKWGHFGRWVLNTLEYIGISFSEHTIVVSEEIRELYWNKYHRDFPIHIIPNGVNEPEYVERGLTLKKYKLKKYILSVGRLVPEKGFDDLIEAYNKIQTDYNSYKLVIVGNGERDSKYKDKLMAKRSENIIFTGFLCGKELAELYTNASLFISTSLNEGFPLVVLEAMSYGLPMLLSNIQPHREVKLHFERYFKDTKDLPLKIGYALERGITKEEKENYKKLLRKKYNWDAIADKMKEDIYE